MVVILHIEDCRSLKPASLLLREALHVTGHRDVPIQTEVVRSDRQAGELRFVGSPTILVDGRDLFPVDPPSSSFGLACRLYQTPAGPRGWPTLPMLVAALNERAGI